MKTQPRKNLWSLSGLALCAMVFIVANTRADEAEPASSSQLTGIQLLKGTLRIAPEAVPEEIMQALKTMIDAGGPQVQRGKTEVLAWTGDGYNVARAPKLKEQIGAALGKAGWEYEQGEAIEDADGCTVVTALKTEPSRQALIGFWAVDKEALVLGWTQMLAADTKVPDVEEEAVDAQAQTPLATTPNSAQSVEKGTVITVSDSQYVVNAAKGLPTPKVTFPALAPKPGKACGYVMGSDGKPLKGAVIGVRSTAVGGAETGAEAKTDDKGYYEIAVPFGAAGFYAAGYTAEYGDGLVALGLTPADGEADEFASVNGQVENWVLLPHGIADRAGAQDDAKYVNNYFGGGVLLYFHDENSMYQVKKLAFGTVAEITFTPQGPLMDGSDGQVITVRKTIRDGAEKKLYINNIPVGRYRISVRNAGKNSPLHLRETGPDAGSAFGLEPKEAQGDAELMFRPYSARAASATAGHGNWKSIDIDISG